MRGCGGRGGTCERRTTEALRTLTWSSAAPPAQPRPEAGPSTAPSTRRGPAHGARHFACTACSAPQRARGDARGTNGGSSTDQGSAVSTGAPRRFPPLSCRSARSAQDVCQHEHLHQSARLRHHSADLSFSLSIFFFFHPTVCS